MKIYNVLKNIINKLKTIDEQLDKLNYVGKIKSSTGTITTKAWNTSQGGPELTLGKEGVYLIVCSFSQTEDNITWSRAYHHFRIQLHGSGEYITDSILLYNIPGSSFGVHSVSSSVLLYAKQGDYLTSYIWTGVTDMTFNVRIAAVYLSDTASTVF